VRWVGGVRAPCRCLARWVFGRHVVAWLGGCRCPGPCGLPGSVAGAVLPLPKLLDRLDAGPKTTWSSARPRPGSAVGCAWVPLRPEAPSGRPGPCSGAPGRHRPGLCAGEVDQPLGQCPAEALGALDGPAALRPAVCHGRKAWVAVQGGRDAQLVQQLAVLVERGGGGGGLVRVDPMVTGIRAPFIRAGRNTPGGQADLGRLRPLWSHSRSGAGRTAQPFRSQPDGGSGACGATCRHPGTRWAAARAPSRIQ
jgi:hypothetical protein